MVAAWAVGQLNSEEARLVLEKSSRDECDDYVKEAQTRPKGYPMSDYFDIIRPEKQTTPILIDVPHTGEWIPEHLLEQMPVEGKALKRDLDLYDELWAKAPVLP